jgi:tRNA-specific 2-thiouridylase
MKVLVGMSGGVDSSMAAVLLKEAGHDVRGASLLMCERGLVEADRAPQCFSPSVDDAARTAGHIGIPHVVIDARDAFSEHVIGPFLDAYARGLTPNPCILCNRHVKFPLLLKEALGQGADFLATGHYGRVKRPDGPSPSGTVLKKGVDPGKDQSYVLYALGREELGRLLLPLGDWWKKDVRARASELGLPVFGRPESQEICFIEDRDYVGFVRTARPDAGRPGPIIDHEGRVLGEHRGIYAYTVGQRKGLGISSPHPLYVTKIDAGENAVFVGPREAAMKRELTVTGLNWLLPREGDFKAEAKVRSMMPARPALVCPVDEERIRVVFDEPVWAPAPGQSAVLYEGDTVLGGGVIEG